MVAGEGEGNTYFTGRYVGSSSDATMEGTARLQEMELGPESGRGLWAVHGIAFDASL